MIRKKVFKTSVLIVVLLLTCIFVFHYINIIKEKENYKNTYIYSLAQKIITNEVLVNSIDDLGIYTLIDLTLSEKNLWDKIPLSNNFKAKYKNPKNIVSKLDNCESISVGIAPEYVDRKAVTILAVKKDSVKSLLTKKNITTEYIF